MRIIKVNYLNDYKLDIVFYNNETIAFDFENFLKNSKHKSISKYLDKNKFKKVFIDTGFLSWNKGEMEISGEWIYEEFQKETKLILQND